MLKGKVDPRVGKVGFYPFGVYFPCEHRAIYFNEYLEFNNQNTNIIKIYQSIIQN